MPIIIHKDIDLFQFRSMCSIAHGVNCVGAMGKGVAVIVKNTWPQMYEEYKTRCSEGRMLPGTCWPWKYEGKWNKSTIDPTFGQSFQLDFFVRLLYVYNVTVKAHWRLPATETMVDGGLKSLFYEMQQNKDTEVAMPMIGCGLGGLDWDTCVFPILKKYSDENPGITVNVCIPKQTP